MTIDEAVVGGGRFGTDAEGYRAMLGFVARWSVFVSRYEVRVGAEGDRRRRVPEELLHLLDRRPAREQLGRRVVPEGVGGHLDARRVGRDREELLPAPIRQRLAELVDEHRLGQRLVRGQGAHDVAQRSVALLRIGELLGLPGQCWTPR